MMTIELGGPIARGGPVKNNHITEVLRNFRGDYCVFVEGCAWRLDRNGAVICGWHEEEIVIRERVQVLAARKLIRAEVSTSAFDLNLFFDHGYVLRLFCDQTVGTLDNYSIRFPSGWYSVQPQSKLARETTDKR